MSQSGWAGLLAGLIGATGGMPASGWIADFCYRCHGRFYVHALANTPFEDIGKLSRLCPWCKGQCSAADQDHRNVIIEAEIAGHGSQAGTGAEEK